MIRRVLTPSRRMFSDISIDELLDFAAGIRLPRDARTAHQWHSYHEFMTAYMAVRPEYRLAFGADEDFAERLFQAWRHAPKRIEIAGAELYAQCYGPPRSR
jgi:hypothetical protein